MIPDTQLRPARRIATAGFTLIELLVVITIIAVLASIALPVYGTVTAKAREAKCVSNLRQLSLALTAFKMEDGAYPNGLNAGQGWFTYIEDYLAMPSGQASKSTILECPAATLRTSDVDRCYAVHPRVMPTAPAMPLKSVDRPSSVILIADAIQRTTGSSSHSQFFNVDGVFQNHVASSTDDAIQIGPNTDGVETANFRYRHRDGANFAMADGSVQRLRKGAVKQKHVRIGP